MLANGQNQRRFLRAFARDESGATAVEYAVIASGIFLTIYLSALSMSTSLGDFYVAIKVKVIAAIS